MNMPRFKAGASLYKMSEQYETSRQGGYFSTQMTRAITPAAITRWVLGGGSSSVDFFSRAPVLSVLHMPAYFFWRVFLLGWSQGIPSLHAL